MNNKGFDEGSLVWLHNPIRSKGKSPKLQAKWDGPYRIETRINDVTYRIQKCARACNIPLCHYPCFEKYHNKKDFTV
ncbi:unnamed protein product [Parnassius mnemosyne]|uniref:Integrase p58-like C-terminal domain-containing protein n=1 Tax=Parnassius mnemosyne TaxID=213953 RepID=A0AAV1LX84_9NEOP